MNDSDRQSGPPGQYERDQDGERRPHRHSMELFGRDPFTYGDEPHYFGTGAPGWGGPGFTGGAYTYGEEGPESRWLPEMEAEYPAGDDYRFGVPYGSGAGPQPSRRRTFCGPRNYQPSDERLKEEISDRLMEAYHIDPSAVTVEVQGGKVALEGTVPDRRTKHAIEDLVEECPGVQDIENRIRVEQR